MNLSWKEQERRWDCFPKPPPLPGIVVIEVEKESKWSRFKKWFKGFSL